MTNMIGRLLSNLLRRRDWRDDVSAYLDGELSAREQGRVEARLAESDEMQAYLDDLREMRSMLRGFAAEPARAPFQLTADMLNTRVSTEIRPGPLERALRVSMTTAAIGVATFSAVVIFDAVDRPSVTFTTTSAGDASTSVPTARIVTQEVEADASGAESAAQSAQSAVAVVSIESSSEQAAQQANEGDDSGGQATAAAYRVEGEEEAAQDWAAQEQADQEQAQEEAAMQQETDERAEAAEEADYEQAAEDPSRRALNAGHGSSDADEQEVNAEDVVAARGEQSDESELTEEANQSARPAAAAEPATQDEEPTTAEAAEAVESTADDGPAPPSAEAEAPTQTRTVATSVRHTESEWPLEQRPQSSSVRLATDPSWEAPVQIALAIVAFGSTLAWFLLTIMDRRRQT